MENKTGPDPNRFKTGPEFNCGTTVMWLIYLECNKIKNRKKNRRPIPVSIQLNVRVNQSSVSDKLKALTRPLTFLGRSVIIFFSFLHSGLNLVNRVNFNVLSPTLESKVPKQKTCQDQ